MSFVYMEKVIEVMKKLILGMALCLLMACQTQEEPFDADQQLQYCSEQVARKIKPKRIMPRHILIKLTKINTKKKNINRSKGKRNKYTRKSP